MLTSFILNSIIVIILHVINKRRGKEETLSNGKLGWYIWHINPWIPLVIWFVLGVLLN